jgi:hypothetical protein
MSSAAIALWAVPKNCSRNSVVMISARADLVVDFKRCCMLSGEFDGSDRHNIVANAATRKSRPVRGRSR